MADPSIPTNPIVEAFHEEESTGIIEVEGYPGPREDGPVRLYRDLSLDRYIEIQEDDVLRISEPDDEEEPIRVYFDSDVDVTYTTTTSVSDSASFSGTLSVPAGEVKRAARSRSRSGCSCGTSARERSTMRREIDTDFQDIELPPLWCEINCEQWLNSCLDSGMGPFWCWLDYYLCRLGCIHQSTGGVVAGRT